MANQPSRSRIRTACCLRALLLPALAAAATSAQAYIGPGAGLTAIGSMLALVIAIALGLIGFVWFPLKRLLRKLRGRSGKDDAVPGPR